MTHDGSAGRRRSVGSPFESCSGFALAPSAARARLLAEVAFTEWTADGKIRHPSFQGLREDKPAGEVVRESPRGP